MKYQRKWFKTIYFIVLCCAAGVRSQKAVDFLRYNGFDNVYNGGSCKDVVNMKENYEIIISFLVISFLLALWKY